MRKVVLSIAGSDPSGGAGVQQDIKVLTVLDTYACAAITAITVQNTMGVSFVEPVSAKLVEKQVTSVLEDIAVSAIKIGMVATRENIASISRALCLKKGAWVVADPVMRSKNNKVLLDDSAWSSYEKLLFPYIDILTPNVHEASVIASVKIDTVSMMEKAAKTIWEKMRKKRKSGRAQGVYLKGGHLKDGNESVDVFCFNGTISRLRAPRIENPHTHGTGCTFSSAFSAYLAKGEDPSQAAVRAKEFVTLAIKAGFALGKGTGPVDPLIFLK